MRRVDGGGADGGATAAELAAGDDCMAGSRARRCFVVGGLPHVAGNIGPSREAATPQSEPDNEFERNTPPAEIWVLASVGVYMGGTSDLASSR